jgi:hypothetical protein
MHGLVRLCVCRADCCQLRECQKLGNVGASVYVHGSVFVVTLFMKSMMPTASVILMQAPREDADVLRPA